MDKNTAADEMIEAAAALKDAEAEMQRTVSLAYFCGASWAEIGRMLGLSKQTAYNRYGKGKDEAKEETPADKAPEATYTEAEEAAGKAALAALQAVDARKTKAEKASKKVDTQAPAIRKKHRITDPDTTAQPGRGRGPHACPACQCTNHKSADATFAEFGADCKPTKYDPPKVASLIWTRNN